MNSFGYPGGRKRVLSMADDSIVDRKRPRVSSISAEFQSQILGGSPSITPNPDRLPRARLLHEDEVVTHSIPHYARPLSGSSSFAGTSRAGTPLSLPIHANEESSLISRSGMALMRSVSAASFRSSSPSIPTYPELSAKHYLRNTKVTVDFAVPSVNSEAVELPLSWSTQNILLFSRGNRVQYKNMSTNEDIGQLCKLQESRGDLRMIECGGVDQPTIVALGTSKGFVQIWDLKSKKMTSTWSTKGIASMRWNGPVLTIGGLKGTIRHYDTRINQTPKMKEQARKVTRHQAKICSLAWNADGNLLASGDVSGTVYCWDSRQSAPLDVGEFVQRRKKMQHPGAVTALTWCPWQSKLLASGDSSPSGKGTIRLWNITTSSPSSTNAAIPGKLELDSQISSLHFSQHCKELLSTHGPGPATTADGPDTQMWPRPSMSMANSVAVHSYPSLRHVTALPAAENGIGGSVLSPSGMKIVLAVPDENKLKVWDVWGKRKEVRRQSSFLDCSIR